MSSELNDDCVASILAYLLSSQLFGLCVSYRNKQLHRCSVKALKQSFAPFSLKPNFVNSDAVYSVCLWDCRNQPIATVRYPKMFQFSPLRDKTESVEIPLSLDGRTELELWLSLVLPIQENIKEVSLRLYERECLPAIVRKSRLTRDSAALQTFADGFSPLFSQLTSFAISGRRILPEQLYATLRAMLGQMTSLSKLEIPSYLLKPMLQRAPGIANSLNELSVYAHYSAFVPCERVLDYVGAAGCAELTHLRYACRTHESYQLGAPHDCIETFAALANLPKLTQLSLDIDYGRPNHFPGNLARIASVFTLSVVIRANNNNDARQWCFFSQFCSVRSLQICPRGDGVLSAVSVFCMQQCSRSLLRKLAITSPPCYNNALLKPLMQLSMLVSYDHLLCVSIDYFVLDFSGFLSDPQPAKYHDLTTAIYGTFSLLSRLERVQMVAKLDSISAIRSKLLGADYVCDLIEKPRLRYPDCFILEPDKYWLPVSMLFVCNMRRFDGNVSRVVYFRLAGVD